MGHHCTYQNPLQCFPKSSRHYCIKKFLLNVALILFGQHSTDQKTMQWCQKSSKQHCIKNYPAPFFLRSSTGRNPMQCCPRGSKQYYVRKNPVQCCINTRGTSLHRSKAHAISSNRLQTTLQKRKSCSTFF